MKKVLDHGFVELVDHMPQENLDKAIVDGARVSYQTGTKTTRGDRGLIRYLVRNSLNISVRAERKLYLVSLIAYCTRI